MVCPLFPYLSGTADIDSNGKIIAEGDTTAAAMQKRARFTIDTVGATLGKLNVSWEDTTQIALFHVADIPNLWGPTLLGTFGEAVRRGVLVYHARPPPGGCRGGTRGACTAPGANRCNELGGTQEG